MSPSQNRPSALHIVLGPPAAGKTTFALRLARSQSAALVDIDTSTEPVVQAALEALDMDPNDRDSARYKHLFRQPIYEALFDIAAANLPHIDVVLTGPFTREIENPKWLEELRATRFPPPINLKAYYISCSPETQIKRLRARGNPRDAAKRADWETYQRYYGDQRPPAFPHEIVETD